MSFIRVARFQTFVVDLSLNFDTRILFEFVLTISYFYFHSLKFVEFSRIIREIIREYIVVRTTLYDPTFNIEYVRRCYLEQYSCRNKKFFFWFHRSEILKFIRYTSIILIFYLINISIIEYL